MAERRPTDRELALNQVWNELIRSGRVPATADLDPIDVDALRQLHRLASASAPASSRERVRRRLREQSPSFGFADAAQGVTMDAANVFPPAMRPPRPIRSTRGVNLLASFDPRALSPALPAGPTPRRWTTGRLATAALLLLTIFAAYVGFAWPQRDRAPILIGSGTPAPSDVLFDAVLPPGALPDAQAHNFFLETVTVSAGQTVVVTPDSAAKYPGPLVDVVLAGSDQFRAGGPAQVFRSGRAQAESVPAGATVKLAPGDAVLRRNEDGWTVTNAGATPLRLLHVSLIPNGPAPPALHWNFEDWQFAEPRPEGALGAIEVQVRRATLDSRTTLPGPAAGVAQAAISADPLQAVAPAADGSLRNLGTDPATLYVLTLRAETPEAATPAVGVQLSPLLTTTATRLPTGMAWIGFAQTTYAPGAVGPSPAPDVSGAAAWTGPDLVYVLSGSLRVTADRPIPVARAATATAGSLPALAPETNPTLAAGDWGVIPPGSAHAFANPDPVRPAVVLETIVTDMTGITLQRGGGLMYGVTTPGVAAELLASETGPTLPSAPARLTLSEATLAPDATLPAPEPGVLQAVAPAAGEDGAIKAFTDGSAANVGNRPAKVWVLSLTALSASATMATPVA